MPPIQNSVFWHAVVDMCAAILIVPKTLYLLDQDMEDQMEEDDEKAHKAYVRLMDLRFPMLVSKRIEIID